MYSLRIMIIIWEKKIFFFHIKNVFLGDEKCDMLLKDRNWPIKFYFLDFVACLKSERIFYML